MSENTNDSGDASPGGGSGVTEYLREVSAESDNQLNGSCFGSIADLAGEPPLEFTRHLMDAAMDNMIRGFGVPADVLAGNAPRMGTVTEAGRYAPPAQLTNPCAELASEAAGTSNMCDAMSRTPTAARDNGSPLDAAGTTTSESAFDAALDAVNHRATLARLGVLSNQTVFRANAWSQGRNAELHDAARTLDIIEEAERSSAAESSRRSFSVSSRRDEYTRLLGREFNGEFYRHLEATAAAIYILLRDNGVRTITVDPPFVLSFLRLIDSGLPTSEQRLPVLGAPLFSFEYLQRGQWDRSRSEGSQTFAAAYGRRPLTAEQDNALRTNSDMTPGEAQEESLRAAIADYERLTAMTPTVVTGDPDPPPTPSEGQDGVMGMRQLTLTQGRSWRPYVAGIPTRQPRPLYALSSRARTIWSSEELQEHQANAAVQSSLVDDIMIRIDAILDLLSFGTVYSINAGGTIVNNCRVFSVTIDRDTMRGRNRSTVIHLYQQNEHLWPNCVWGYSIDTLTGESDRPRSTYRRDLPPSVPPTAPAVLISREPTESSPGSRPGLDL